jgi:putative RNA 2'-phosphotransferase
MVYIGHEAMSVRASKFLSLVLRHEPGRIGIVLDEHGWTDVAALLEACAAQGLHITRDELAEIVATSDKQRFALSGDGERIRANQGHSIAVDLQLEQLPPPARLYHGTVPDALASIREHGLVRGARHHVHLSASEDTATRVGGRRGKPVVLVVHATEMAAAGHAFFRSANGVWLVDHVPAEFLEIPAPRGAGNANRSAKVGIAKATLAACEAGYYANARGERVELAALVEAARTRTTLHELGAALSFSPRATPAEVAVTGESTIAAMVRLAPRGGHLACLNFASAKNPGGGFLGGAQAQEETLARASGLYPCLLAQPDYYARNRATRTAHYLDLAIVSRGVPFFRDDEGGWLDAPVLATVITCPAPNAGALRQHGRFDAAEVEATLRRRGRFVLELAAHHGVDHLVLGAWGAGVFGNDPLVVARAFAGAMPPRGFASVVYAVLGETTANHRAFAEVFG